nr:MAG TPA: SEP domain [Caudoviricetes sp.]DAW61899.1 MAG TPA: SEP domain [Caudoviricetes sp.]
MAGDDMKPVYRNGYSRHDGNFQRFSRCPTTRT